jgi:hypothetical protein
MAEKEKKTARYEREVQSPLDVVAIRKGQTEVNAPEHVTWRTLRCDACADEFLIGPPKMFAVFEKEDQYLQRLQETLRGEHKRGHQHQNSYELGS